MSKTILKYLKEKPVIIIGVSGEEYYGILLDVDKLAIHLIDEQNNYFAISLNERQRY